MEAVSRVQAIRERNSSYKAQRGYREIRYTMKMAMQGLEILPSLQRTQDAIVRWNSRYGTLVKQRYLNMIGRGHEKAWHEACPTCFAASAPANLEVKARDHKLGYRITMMSTAPCRSDSKPRGAWRGIFVANDLSQTTISSFIPGQHNLLSSLLSVMDIVDSPMKYEIIALNIGRVSIKATKDLILPYHEDISL
jgi:hypothetical protein